MFARYLFLTAIRSSVRHSSSSPKVKAQQMISLIGRDGKIVGVKTRAEAEAIAKKSNLMLKRHFLPGVQETKHVPYIMYDPKDELNEPLDNTGPVSVTDKPKKSAKGMGVRDKKKVTIGATINDHDIETKAKAIAKFLKANVEVQVLAYGSVKNERLEEIYKKFEQLFTGLRLVQKIVKPGSLKFTILPDPEKFTGLTLTDDQSHSGSGEVDADAIIDDKEVEQLVQEKLKEKK
jgi:translation initiation factor IF-3